MSENQNRQRSTDYFLPPRRKLVMAPEGRHIMAVFRRRQFSEEKGICHMTKATIAKLPDPSGFSPDPLTEVLRTGERRLIEQAVEAEPSHAEHAAREFPQHSRHDQWFCQKTLAGTSDSGD
jgi:hypothetical protein